MRSSYSCYGITAEEKNEVRHTNAVPLEYAWSFLPRRYSHSATLKMTSPIKKSQSPIVESKAGVFNGYVEGI